MNENDDQQHSSTSYKSNIKWAMESIANIQVPASQPELSTQAGSGFAALTKN